MNDECTVYTAASQAAASWSQLTGYCKDDNDNTPQYWANSDSLPNNGFWNVNGDSNLNKRKVFCEWACLELSGDNDSNMYGNSPNKKAECIAYEYDEYNCKLYLSLEGANSCRNYECNDDSSGAYISLRKYWSEGMSSTYTFGYYPSQETIPTQVDASYGTYCNLKIYNQ